MIQYSYDFEQVLDQAAKIDEQLNDSWMSICADEEYQKLMEFFDKGNYYDSWEEVDFDRETVIKNLKRILVGTDRIRLIEYAFDIGRLVGRAEYTLFHQDD